MRNQSEGPLFGKAWFLKHQPKLLRFINTREGKRFFRVLKDVPKGKRIVKILPNCFTWREHGKTYTTTFYTHNKFSKRLYHGLKPLWYVLHFLDWLLFDRFIPEYSFGFSTLTVYPDADPETNSVDGIVRRNVGGGDTWSQIRDGAGTASDDSVAESPGSCPGVGFGITDDGGAFAGLGRVITLFDTSDLGAVADIVSAILGLDCALSKDNFLMEGEDELCVTACSPASNTSLASSDYNIANWSDTKLANEIDKDSLAGHGAYTDWTLNASGLAQISKTGVTKLGLRFSADINDIQPTPSVDYECTTVTVRFADYGAGSAPKLVITYTVGDVTIPANTQSVTVNLNAVTVNFDAVLPVSSQSVVVSIPAVSVATDWYMDVPVQTITISVIAPDVYEGSLIDVPVQTITIDLPIGSIITDSYVPVNPAGLTISVQPAIVVIIYEAIITPDVFTVSMLLHSVKILLDLTAQLLDRSRLRVVYILDITLQNSGPTLHISDQNIVSISGQRYELYLKDLSGLGEEIERATSKGLNPDIDLTFLNDRSQDKNHLIELGDTYPFEGAECVIKEAYLDDNDVPSGEVIIFKGNLDEPRDVDQLSFSCGVSSVVIIKDRQFKQAKITTADYPNADPDDLNKVLNTIYGAPEQIRCHAIKAGAASALAEDITDVQMSFEISDASQFPASAAFTYQVEAEQIRILSRSGNVLTVDTGGRGYNSTDPATHDKGQTGYEVLTEYIYLVAGHPVTSLSNIQVDKVRQLTGFTVYTGQSGDEHGSYPGKAVIAFATKPVVEKQVNLAADDTIDVSNPTHAHQFTGATQDQNSNNLPFIPAGSCINAFGETDYANFNDIASTYQGNSFSVSFDRGSTRGGCYQTSDGYIEIGGVRVYEIVGGVVTISKPSPIAFEGALTGSERNRVKIKAYLGGAAQNNGMWCDITACSRTVVYNDASQSAVQNTLKVGGVTLTGNSSADVVIGSSVNCDVEGYRDDGAGTYTGTPDALIERPDHVKKHFIDVLYGFTLTDINTASFSAAGALFASAISGGYKFAFVINEEITPSEFLEELAEQCRSNLKYEAGKWYLDYIPDTAPSPAVTISKSELAGKNAKFVFYKTSVLEIINDLQAEFKKNYGRLKYDESEWLGSAADSDSASQTKHGVRPNNKPYKFWAIRLQAMADHVLAFKKLQHKDTLWIVTFPVFWEHFTRKRGDTFDISNDINNGKKFYIEEIVRIGKYKLGIRALEWP